jgi:type IV secretory pathway TrbD component
MTRLIIVLSAIVGVIAVVAVVVAVAATVKVARDDAKIRELTIRSAGRATIS